MVDAARWRSWNEFNVIRWYPDIRDYTFPSQFVTVSRELAAAMVAYQDSLLSLDPTLQEGRRKEGGEGDRDVWVPLKEQLPYPTILMEFEREVDDVIRKFYPETGAFVKCLSLFLSLSIYLSIYLSPSLLSSILNSLDDIISHSQRSLTKRLRHRARPHPTHTRQRDLSPFSLPSSRQETPSLRLRGPSCCVQSLSQFSACAEWRGGGRTTPGECEDSGGRQNTSAVPVRNQGEGKERRKR